MECSGANLFGLIFFGHRGVRAQIGGECQMPIDIWPTIGIAVQLKDSLSGDWIIATAVAPSRKTELAKTFIAEQLDALHFAIEAVQISDDRNEIDDRFGHDT